jgi:hypothetical protein
MRQTIGRVLHGNLVVKINVAKDNLKKVLEAMRSSDYLRD